MRRDPGARLDDLVLVGGGHAHVQVLRSFAAAPPTGVRVTLVVDRPIAVYSGMVPGLVAGQYRREELEIDVVPLARKAAARVILAPALGLDPAARRLEVEGRPPVAYDVVSFDVGSTVAGLEVPGVRRYALATRPIGEFVGGIERLVADHAGGRSFAAAVVGGGAAGVELAFALAGRCERSGLTGAAITLVEAGPEILAGYPAGLVRRVRAAAAGRSVRILTDHRVRAAEAGRLLFETGDELTCDALLWAAGAASQPLFRGSGLATDEKGFLLVRETLQVEGHPEVLAAGDCATLSAYPETPKAGVYAVREGPVLTHNLRASLTGGTLRSYRPQADFLTLLNLGDGSAVGSKWGLAFGGRPVMKLKDRIDRRFVRRYQVLEAMDTPVRQDPAAAAMAAEMPCGGCAAKLARTSLEAVLERLPPSPRDPTVELGLGAADDAVAWKLPGGDRVVSSLDVFTAFTDDPWLVGRVAATNALSDLWAKGVEPRYAQAFVSLPEASTGGGGEERRREEMLEQVLLGARAAFDPAGVTLLGGHTTLSPELMVGFAVDAVAGATEPLLPLAGLVAGQVLLLSKPLGTGVLLRADMMGMARGPWLAAVVDAMTRANAAAAAVARACGATAVTDVTGFGLLGHLVGMLAKSGVGAVLRLAELPALPGAVELLGRGVRSTFHARNAAARRGLRVASELADDPRLELLFDPQTSGGLLFGVPPTRADEALRRLREGGDGGAAVIGEVAEGGEPGLVALV